MNFWAKIYIICQISRGHSFPLISLLQLQKWGHTMVYAVGKKEKNCFHVLSWLLFFAGGGLSRQWKEIAAFLQHVVLWGYIREKFPAFFSKLFLCETTFRKKCALQKQRWLFKVWLSFWLMTRQLSRDHLTSFWLASAQEHNRNFAV